MHTCEAIVVTCIDFRLQEYIDNWIRKKFDTKNHDRVAFVGGVKDFETIFKQIKVSKRLHDIKKVVLINHEDCGAYGEAGTKEKHTKDLKEIASKIKQQIPDVEVETYYLHLNGSFEAII